jgi:predicted AAA+ superfamily ATPase
MKARPKVYATDHGMVAAFSPIPRPMDHPQLRSKALAATVFRHLREVAGRSFDTRLTYFRERERHELEFVFETSTRSTGVAVTTSREPEQALSAALAAAGRAKLEHLVLVHGGARHERRDRATLIPWFRFLLDPLEALDG